MLCACEGCSPSGCEGNIGTGNTRVLTFVHPPGLAYGAIVSGRICVPQQSSKEPGRHGVGGGGVERGYGESGEQIRCGEDREEKVNEGRELTRAKVARWRRRDRKHGSTAGRGNRGIMLVGGA